MAVAKVRFFSETLHMMVPAAVILPEEVEISDTGLKTVWTLHGGNGDYREWLYDSCVARYAQEMGIAVVLLSVYNSFGMNMAHGAAYADFLQEEVMGKVRSLFPSLSHSRENNYAAGASMGGFAAFRWAVNRPEQFESVGAFAGAIYMEDIFRKYLEGTQSGGPDFINAFGNLNRLIRTDNDIFYMTAQNIREGKKNPRMYLLCGRDDFGFEQNKAAFRLLKEAGEEPTFRAVEGGHSFSCWDPYITDMFTFFMKGGKGNGKNPL